MDQSVDYNSQYKHLAGLACVLDLTRILQFLMSLIKYIGPLVKEALAHYENIQNVNQSYETEIEISLFCSESLRMLEGISKLDPLYWSCVFKDEKALLAEQPLMVLVTRKGSRFEEEGVQWTRWILQTRLV